jgi:hypothetical protein
VDVVKISVLCFDLADNAAGRAFLLARLLEPLGDVELVGPCYGAGVWPPIAGGGVPCRLVPGRRLPAFAVSMAALARLADEHLPHRQLTVREAAPAPPRTLSSRATSA